MMTKLKRSVLVNLASKVVSVTEKRGVLPILSNVLLRLHGDQIEMVGSDLEISIIANAACTGETVASVLLPGKRFFDLLKEFEEEDITFEIFEREVRIKQGSAAFDFPLQDPADFPILQMDGGREMVVRCEDLLRALDKVSFAASTDDSKYVLTGVYLEAEDRLLTSCATDGYRLALFKGEAEGIQSFAGIVVPKRAVSEVERLFRGQERVSLRLGKGYFSASGGGCTIVCRLIDETFPNYKSVLPVPQAVASCQRLALTRAIKRASVLIGKSEPLQLVFRPDVIRVSAESELGRAEELVPASYSGEERVLHFNVRFLLEALSHMEGESVEIGLGSAYGPVELQGGEDNYRNIIMPVRV